MTSQLWTAWPCESRLLVGVSSWGSKATPGSHYLLLVVHSANTPTPRVCIPDGTISSAWNSPTRWKHSGHHCFFLDPLSLCLRPYRVLRSRNIWKCFKISVHAFKLCTTQWCEFTGSCTISDLTKCNWMLFKASTNLIQDPKRQNNISFAQKTQFIASYNKSLSKIWDEKDLLFSKWCMKAITHRGPVGDMGNLSQIRIIHTSKWVIFHWTRQCVTWQHVHVNDFFHFAT